MEAPSTDPLSVRITGVGLALPSRVVTTAEVEERAGLTRLGLEPGWLERVTGVRERRWAGPEVRPSDLAAAAGRQALVRTGLDPLAIDTLIFAGITRDFIEPATVNVVQELIGAHSARVFDLTNACNGVVDALDVAEALIRTGRARRVLITTGERASIAIDWRLSTVEQALHAAASLVVGDGGGALIVELSDDPGRGLRAREYRSDGRHWRLATGGRFRPSTEACGWCGSTVELPFTCNGRELFAAVFAVLAPVMTVVLERSGWSLADVDVVFCHEASKRFVEAGLAELGDPAELGRKVWSTVGRLGNTSTVSLPLAMAEAEAAGVLVPGAKVLVLAGSSGVSAAALALVW